MLRKTEDNGTRSGGGNGEVDNRRPKLGWQDDNEMIAPLDVCPSRKRRLPVEKLTMLEVRTGKNIMYIYVRMLF